jgi:hypothetical protein
MIFIAKNTGVPIDYTQASSRTTLHISLTEVDLNSPVADMETACKQGKQIGNKVLLDMNPYRIHATHCCLKCLERYVYVRSRNASVGQMLSIINKSAE